GASVAARRSRRGWRSRSDRARCAWVASPAAGSSSWCDRRAIDDAALDAVRAAAEERDEAARGAVAHLDIVDAAASSTGALTRHGDQRLAALRRADEMNLGTGRDGDLVARVAGEGERAVREREDQPAMAEVMAVDHVVAHRHAHAGEAGADLLEHHAERARRLVGVVHGAPDSLRDALRAGGAHQRPLNWAGRFSRKAATPSLKSSERAARRCRSRSTSSCASRLLASERLIACLMRPSPAVGPCASLAARPRASAISLSSSTTFQIRPHCAALSAESGSPSIAMPMARADPARRGRNQVPPASGTNPRRQKACRKLAERAAMTMSQAKAMLAPAPAAGPLTAATTGFASARSRRMSG